MIEHNERCANGNCAGCDEAHKDDPECDDSHPRHYHGKIYEGPKTLPQMDTRECPYCLPGMIERETPLGNRHLHLPADTSDDGQFLFESKDHEREVCGFVSNKWESGKGDSDRYLREPEEVRVYPEVQGIAEVDDLKF